MSMPYVSDRKRFAARNRITTFVRNQIAAGKTFDEYFPKACEMKTQMAHDGSVVYVSEEDFLRAVTDANIKIR